MGISNDVMSMKKGDTIDGKHGVYVLGDEIGCGGNGTVYDVHVANRKDKSLCDGQEVVIKILTVSNIKSDAEKKKRRERFQREIKVVRQLSDSDLDVLPIIDSYMDAGNYSCEWYAMPKAKEYKYSRSGSGLEKIKQLRQMGDTLSKLHKKGVFHRDIKPTNILYYKNRCFLTDFGLAWNIEEDSHITGKNEPLGPVGIRPPEMENDAEKLNIEIDYQKVDVYLYVKTIWIILTGNRKGFRGEYNRADQMIYLDRNKFDLGRCIEPLHRMMEEATRHLNTERITIDNCLEYIDQQIAIAENALPDRTISSLLYNEKISETKSQIASDAVVFDKPEKIIVVLSKMENIVEIVGEEFGEPVLLGLLYRVEYIGEDRFMLSLRSSFPLVGRRNRKLYVRITQMFINNDNIINISTDTFTSFIASGSTITNIGEYSRNMDSDIVLNGKYNLTLKK